MTYVLLGYWWKLSSITLKYNSSSLRCHVFLSFCFFGFCWLNLHRLTQLPPPKWQLSGANERKCTNFIQLRKPVGICIELVSRHGGFITLIVLYSGKEAGRHGPASSPDWLAASRGWPRLAELLPWVVSRPEVRGERHDATWTQHLGWSPHLYWLSMESLNWIVFPVSHLYNSFGQWKMYLGSYYE